MSSEMKISQVMPQISVESVDQQRSFYIDQLGFSHEMGVVGKDGELEFCIVARDGAGIMFNRPTEPCAGASPVHPTRRPIDLYISIGDVDGYHAKLAARGVTITSPLTTQWWGDRTFAVTDPYGYQVWFYQTVAEPDPPAGVKIV